MVGLVGLLINCNQEIAKEAAEVPGSVAWFPNHRSRWQMQGGCPKFLRWSHGEPLGESLVASVPLGWKRVYSGVRFTKAEAWLVRLSNLFQQRL